MVELQPVKNYIPPDLNLSSLSYDEALKTKRGMSDNTLQRYYTNDVVEVYSVDEAKDPSNVKIPDLVLEKTPNESKTEQELKFAILADELGSGVEVLYLRENEDGDAVYGMPFLSEWGMFEDIKFNGFTDFLDHARAIGESYGPLYDANIIHEDLIGMRTSGPWRGTPYLRNIMVSGNADEADIIDLEDARFADDASKKDLSKHLHEMNPANRDEEYQAIENAILVEGVTSLDHFDNVANREIKKTDLLYQHPVSGLNYIDPKNFAQSEVSNADINALVNEIEGVFQEGWHEGQINADEFYRNTISTNIPINSPLEDRMEAAAKTRMKGDIEPAVKEWLEGFE